MNLDINQMKSLLLLHELGSLQAVAARRSVSPGAVHHQLRLLEESTQSKLYRKGRNRLEITEAGRAILPFISSIVEQQEAAAHALHDVRDPQLGAIRLGAGPSFSTYLLPGLLKRYRQKFPKVEIYIETGNGDHLFDRLHSGELDLTFDLAGPPNREIEEVAGWRSRLGFIASSRLCGVRARLSDLRHFPFILFQKGSRIDSLIQSWFDGLSFHPKVIMRSDSAEAIKAMLRAQLGMAVLFTWNINPDIRTRSLHEVRTQAEQFPTRMALFRRCSAYLPRAISNFIETAKNMNWPNLHPMHDLPL